MRLDRNTFDLTFSEDMDFIFDEDKSDLKTTNDVEGELTIQMIIKRVFSSRGDWLLQSECGANLESFKGFEVNSDLISLVKSSIINELTRELMIDPRAIAIKAIPMGKTRLSLVIIVKTQYMKTPVVVAKGLSLDSYVSVSNKANRIK